MSESKSIIFYKRAKFWRGLLLQSLLLMMVYAGMQLWQSRNAVTGQAPPINTVLLSGKQVSLSDYAGKPVLVHFWASWCSICRFEESSISAIAKDYAVLTIASRSGDADSLRTYIKEHDLRFPVIEDELGEWAQLYGVKGYPSSFIIAADGSIYDVEIGYSSNWGLRLRLFLAGL
ncbi:MAG: protein disulfide oxidoreductase [Sulfuriflexus sp.]|nr:protein disulfide oxidoreductase [Sulfuriflexus sp.]